MEGNIATKEIIEYLKQIVEIESSIYSQERIKAQTETGFQYLDRGPVKEKFSVSQNTWEEIEKPKEPDYEQEAGWSMTLGCGGVSVIFGIIFIAISLETLGILMFVVAVAFIKMKWDDRRIKDENEWKRIQYEKERRKYSEKVEEEKERHREKEEECKRKNKEAEEKYKIEKENWLMAYRKAKMIISQLDECLNETKAVLEELYSVGLIFPKYRNMVAMCTIYEYFASGRVTSLEGPDGAYNLYESELRQNIIINKLDTIIMQLEQVKQNQYILYNEISKTNTILNKMNKEIAAIHRKTDEIVELTQKIAVSSSITASYSKAIAKNTEALKYISLING